MLIGKDPGVDTLPAEAVAEALTAGATVVTATQRLARRLVTDYALQRREASWPTPDVLPWGAWLGRAYRTLRDYAVLADPRPVLDDAQSAWLWETVLRADPHARHLLMLPGAAAECREAWRLVHDWCLPESEILARGGEDSRRFVGLARAYQRRVEEAGYVDAAVRPGIVAAHAGSLPESRVIFHGFERLPPAVRRVMDALGGRAGRTLDPALGGRPRITGLPDPAGELEAAVAWARSRLEADPAARIGLVVPDLEARAAMLEDLLDEAFSPGRLLPAGLDGPRPWNLSLGRPLADAPVVAAALGALAAGTGTLASTGAGRLLRSPYIGEAEREAGPRACLDAWLRQEAGDPVPAGRLAGWARRGQGGAPCPAFDRRLSALLDVLWAPPRRRAPSAWAEAFARALGAMGWPGETPLDSVEYQATGAWAELLDTLARLDGIVGETGLEEALGRLRRLAGERTFQPESPDVPVQVMGLLETPGQTFDALWVCGLHDGVLPAPLDPSPLLPASLQREHGMPRACPETELALARARVARLADSAPEVVMSWPWRQDEEPLRPSPVLRGLPALEETWPAVPRAAPRQRETARLETFRDERATPAGVRPGGGTGLLRAQSACPFQAYGRYRLGCEPLGQPAPGVDPMTRGQLLHEALRIFWDETRDQATLAVMDPAGRRGRVRTAVEAAVTRIAGSDEGRMAPVMLAIEADLAVARIEELLARDLARTPFRAVRLEEWVDLAVGPLSLRGCVDRVDEVAGGFAVIDYKSGAARRGDWAGERPREPQLPVYAVNLPGTVAVAFGSLKPGSVEYQGIARDKDAMGVVGPAGKDQGEEAWASVLEEWRSVVDALAADIAAGDARVDPREGRRTCEYCGLKPLCRRDELAAAGAIRDD